jgi:hypothetical protein
MHCQLYVRINPNIFIPNCNKQLALVMKTNAQFPYLVKTSKQ